MYINSNIIVYMYTCYTCIVFARIGHTLAETFNYGEGCWDPRDCNQMYKGLSNLIRGGVLGPLQSNVQGVVQSYGEGRWDHYNQMYRGLSNLNYGEGFWDHCNQMYRGLFNLNYYK